MTAAQAGMTFEAAAGAVLYGDYAHGVECSWHGSSRDALIVNDHGEQPHLGCLRCPACNGPVIALPEVDFWAKARHAEKDFPGYEAMLRWSAGKCFPEAAALVDAWRQASTE